MLRLWVALGAFVTLVATGVACGSSTPPTPTAAPEPTPTERPQAAPTEKPQATPTGKSQVTSTERPQATPTERPQVAPTEEPQVDPQEADALRKLAFAYWEAFNAYDADRALGYLEEDYRQQQDSAVRDDIGMIKLFSVKLGGERGDPASGSRQRRMGNVLDHEGAIGHATHSHGLPEGRGGVEDHICRGGKVASCSKPSNTSRRPPSNAQLASTTCRLCILACLDDQLQRGRGREGRGRSRAYHSRLCGLWVQLGQVDPRAPLG